MCLKIGAKAAAEDANLNVENVRLSKFSNIEASERLRSGLLAAGLPG